MKSEVKAGVLLSYLIIIANTFLGLLITPFLLRSFGQSEYGIYTLIGSLTGYLTLMDFGTSTTTVRYISKYRAENDRNKINQFIGTILSFYVLVGFFILLFGGIIYFYIDVIFGKSIPIEQMPMAKKMLLIVIINATLSMLMNALPAIITAYEKFTFSKLAEIFRIILRVILIFLFLKLGGSAITVVIIDTILNVLLTFLRLYYVKNKLKIKLKFNKIEFAFVKEIGQFSFFIFLASIVNQVNVKADQLILGMVSSTEEIAISGVASKLIQYYHQFAVAISGVFLPRITSMVTNNYSIYDIQSYAVKVGKLQGKTLILIIIGFLSLGRQFISLWAGEGYESVYIVVIILMISNLGSYTQGIILSLTQAMNKHGYRNIVYFVITILNVSLSIPLAAKYGAVGATVATGITMIVGYYIFIQAYYHNVIGINMFVFVRETILKPIPSAIVALLSVSVVDNFLTENIITFLIKLVVMILVYGVTIWYTDTTSFEKDLLKGFLHKFKRIF